MTASDIEARPLAMIGAGGHARVLLALGSALGREFLGVYDPELAKIDATSWRGLPVLGTDEDLAAVPRTRFDLLNGIGQRIGSDLRRHVHERLTGLGFKFAPVVHPAAWVAVDAMIADGVQIMAGAVVQPGCSIGEGSIVNTRASVDHDCTIGRHVHIAPGATLCGTIEVGCGAFIGAGAVIVQNLRIGSGAIIAAGATAARDVPSGHILMPGAPARPISMAAFG